MVTNALPKVRAVCRENALWKVRLKLSLPAPYTSQEVLGTVLGSFFSSTIDTIDTIEPLSIVSFRFLTKQTLYAVTDPPPSTVRSDPPYSYLYYYTILYLLYYVYIV